MPTGSHLNRLVCEAALAGDALRLQELLNQGANPGGYFDAAEAEQRRKEMMMQLATSPEHPGLAQVTGEVKDGIAACMQGILEAMGQKIASGPFDMEIPLFSAASSGNAECVRILLDRGADVQVRDSSRRSAIYSASSVEVAQLLHERGLPLEDADEYEWSPLTAAVVDAEFGLARVRALIAAGANVNATHDKGYTVFMSAAGSSERCLDVLRALVEAGADPHAVTQVGYNAYHAAVDVSGESNAEESVRATLGYLKSLGVNMEHRNEDGHTPLARAIQWGTGLEVRVLCELGADVNAVCTRLVCGGDECEADDLPLLFHAVDGMGVHKDEKVAALLKAGADPLARNKEGLTPLEVAVADLCAGADQPAKLQQEFAIGFVAAATDEPRARTFVERFAAKIPIPKVCEFDAPWRQEAIRKIATLAAYEAAARRR